MSRWRFALVAGAACLIARSAAAADPVVERPVDDSLEIVVVASPPLRALVHEAVDPLLPGRDRIVWIDQRDAGTAWDAAAEGPHRSRIRIDVPGAGAARVTLYRSGEPPVVRALDRSQSAPVTIESVAQIVHATARELLASAEDVATSRAIENTAPPAAVMVRRSGAVDAEDPRTWPPEAPPRTQSFSVGLAYVQRSILTVDHFVDPRPSEKGLSGSVSMSVSRGAVHLLASMALDYTQASVENVQGVPLVFGFVRYQACAMLGLGVRPLPWFLIVGTAGAGIDASRDRVAVVPDYAWHLMGRAALAVSVAVPALPWGIEAVGAATVDLRGSQSFLHVAPSNSDYFGFRSEFITSRVQPGFALGVAWRY